MHLSSLRFRSERGWASAYTMCSSLPTHSTYRLQHTMDVVDLMKHIYIYIYIYWVEILCNAYNSCSSQQVRILETLEF